MTKIILAVIIISMTSIVSFFVSDFEKTLEGEGLTKEQLEQTAYITKIFTIIGSPFLALISIIITFFIFIVISKIMKSKVSNKSVFSATLSYILFTGIVNFIVNFIQFIMGLSTSDYTITSLNIFDKGNEILEAINLQYFIGAYIFGVMLFGTNKLTKGKTIIMAAIYLLIYIGFNMLSVLFN
ncbi:hypothetical protein BU657_10025 [Staphylococcus chromogenes]|nr:hypothetical protein BU657_10025 [Staphylococcus chromogenes]RIM14501.1 hypothetical protein BU672_11450 [Staphylococcus chromogenes]